MITNINVEMLMPKNHAYRKVVEVMDLRSIVKEFEELYSKRGAPAIPIEKGIKALLIQFMEDYSDRQMECALRENNAVKWFCGYELLEETPDHTYFCKLRSRLGTKNVAKIFNTLVAQIKSQGLSGNVFHFIDASSVVTKTALWSERDRAITDGEEKLNNLNIENYSADKDARFGCKGKDKFWFGYKRHVSVDMQSGIVQKVAITPANVPDAKGLEHVCPSQGMVLADKAYCVQSAQQTIRAHGCHSGAILKENMKQKNKDKDAWLTKIRMPYEHVFSKLSKRARYRGRAKVQLQAFMEAIAHNLRRWVKLKDDVHLAMA